MHSVKIYLGIGILVIAFIVTKQLITTFDGKMHIVICDVGQGDAVYIKTSSGKELLFDGGPDDSVLECLDKVRPFWDRKIDVMILSHPHYDHFRGLISVLENYEIKLFLHEELSNESTDYEVFREMVELEKVEVRSVSRGTKIHLEDEVFLKVLGPDKEFLKIKNPEGITEGDNPPSIIVHLSYNSFDMLLTGDSDGEDIVRFVPAGINFEVMQIPHHGSRNGYTRSAAQRVKSQMGVISNAEKNSYGHPHQEVIDELQKNKTIILRTDTQGSITFKVDRLGKVDVSSF